ncbi:MAG: hypothetical protein V4574_05760 [Pseudomonadota bacterium]
MSQKPPLPEASQSPYPLTEAPEESEALAAVREMAEARKRWNARKQIGVGAAIGVGSAAVVAALLYWRGNRK